MKPLLDISDLNLQLDTNDTTVHVLKQLNFSIGHDETLGLVGPSGCGKSMCLKSIIRLLEAYPHYELSGSIKYENKDVKIDSVSADISSINELRSKEIGIIFQQSSNVLNPSIRVGKQIEERLVEITDLRKSEKQYLVLEALSKVGLVPADRFYKSFPHELSGGQLQRCLIALAIINRPKLLLADEPCSNLDAENQKSIITLLQRLREEYSMSVLFVSHDHQLVYSFCDRIIYMSEGRIIDFDPANNLEPQNKVAINSISQKDSSPIVELLNVDFSYDQRRFLFKEKGNSVLDNFSFVINRGQIKGLVGESGSGKSTIAKIITGQIPIQSGTYRFNNQDISKFRRSERLDFRRSIQMIFQDSYAAMPPHVTAIKILKDTAKANSKAYDNNTIEASLKWVGLSKELLYRLPSQLSGGQRQRLMIAKALLVEPELLVCDEILSSIDSSNKSGILEILYKLNQESNLTILFISHDIKVVKELCEDCIMMT